MPILETLIFLFGSALAAAAVVSIAYLAISTVRNYLRERRARNVNKEAVIMNEQLASGKVKVVTGFFDKEDEELSDVQVWEADDVDSEIAGMKDGKVVIVR